MPKAGIASAIPAFGLSVILLISGGDAPDTVAGWCIGGGNTKKEAATHPGLQPPTKNYYGNNLVLCLFKVCFLWQKTI